VGIQRGSWDSPAVRCLLPGRHAGDHSEIVWGKKVACSPMMLRVRVRRALIVVLVLAIWGNGRFVSRAFQVQRSDSADPLYGFP
jgi:hypothetical protein